VVWRPYRLRYGPSPPRPTTRRADLKVGAYGNAATDRGIYCTGATGCAPTRPDGRGDNNRGGVVGATGRSPLQRAIAATDRKIDALVYELYGLTDEEITIVEGS